MGSSSNLGKKSCDNVPLSLKGLNLALFRSKIFAKTNKFATPFLQGLEFAHSLITHALIHSLLMRSFTHRSCAHTLISLKLYSKSHGFNNVCVLQFMQVFNFGLIRSSIKKKSIALQFHPDLRTLINRKGKQLSEKRPKNYLYMNCCTHKF